MDFIQQILFAYFQSTYALVSHKTIALTEHHFSAKIYGDNPDNFATIVLIYGYRT